MTPLATCTLDAIRRYALLQHGRRVLIALSGGADSVAMLFVLRELAANDALTIAGVAHLNHQLRGGEADADEAFCRALASGLALPFRSERVDIAALARARRRSVEDTARAERYAFLSAAAAALGADAVAVAHTRDDQAETFLLRLVRGAGARGLGGIRPRVRLAAVAPEAPRWVIRPLLDVRRSDLREYLRTLQEPFRDDATNADVRIPRNRVRHELLPYLEAHFSPGIVDVLAREASLAQQDEQYLNGAADDLARDLVSTDVDGALVVDAGALAAAPAALATRIVRDALERAARGRPVSAGHIHSVLELAAQAAPGSLNLPGQMVARHGPSLTFVPCNARRAASPAPRGPHAASGTPRPARREANSFAFPLSIPGEVCLAVQGVAVCAEKLVGEAARLRKWKAKDREVGVAPESLRLPLAVRSRRPGDRFRPLGAPGVRKLQDFLVDRKVPRQNRDTLPLVVDGNDRIVWVVGESVAEDFRVTDPSRGVLLLKVKRLGGPG